MRHLSKQQARKLIVLSNHFHHLGKLKSVAATLGSIESLGYVQIDTISVVNRAHLHVLWSRNHHFNERHLTALYQQKQVFEYWSHAAAVMPMRDYHFSLLRKHQIAAGDKHWHQRNPKMMSQVKAIIIEEGAKKSSDFKFERKNKSQWWDWKPAKLALEQLFMEGDLMVTERQGFQKVYDLCERVLPAKTVTAKPTIEAFCRYLIERYLYAQGMATAEHIAYLRKGIKADIKACVDQMYSNHELEKVSVNKLEYYVLPERLDLLNKRQNRTVHILSPFDNLVIQRKRLVELFDYDYQIECYVPAAKRRFGYFCLPILFGNELVGRIDCKAHRKEGILKVNKVFQEKNIKDESLYQKQFQKALVAFALFNQCNEVQY